MAVLFRAILWITLCVDVSATFTIYNTHRFNERVLLLSRDTLIKSKVAHSCRARGYTELYIRTNDEFFQLQQGISAMEGLNTFTFWIQTNKIAAKKYEWRDGSAISEDAWMRYQGAIVEPNESGNSCQTALPDGCCVLLTSTWLLTGPSDDGRHYLMDNSCDAPRHYICVHGDDWVEPPSVATTLVPILTTKTQNSEGTTTATTTTTTTTTNTALQVIDGTPANTTDSTDSLLNATENAHYNDTEDGNSRYNINDTIKNALKDNEQYIILYSSTSLETTESTTWYESRKDETGGPGAGTETTTATHSMTQTTTYYHDNNFSVAERQQTISPSSTEPDISRDSQTGSGYEQTTSGNVSHSNTLDLDVDGNQEKTEEGSGLGDDDTTTKIGNNDLNNNKTYNTSNLLDKDDDDVDDGSDNENSKNNDNKSGTSNNTSVPSPAPVEMLTPVEVKQLKKELVKKTMPMLKEASDSNPPKTYQKCPCACGMTFDPNPPANVLDLMVAKIQKELKVDPASLSAKKNKKQSNSDQRSSSVTMGVFAITLCILEACLIVGLDCIRFCQHVYPSTS